MIRSTDEKQNVIRRRVVARLKLRVQGRDLIFNYFERWKLWKKFRLLFKQ